MQNISSPGSSPFVRVVFMIFIFAPVAHPMLEDIHMDRAGKCQRRKLYRVNLPKMEDKMDEIFQRTMWQLERLTKQRFSLQLALDQLEKTSHHYRELLIINVIREAYDELIEEESQRKIA